MQSPTSVKENTEMKMVLYSSAVGMMCTMLDIAYAIGFISRFLRNLRKEHWLAVKWIIQYLRGRSTKCLCFGKGKPVLEGYRDADMTGDIDFKKSTLRYLTTFTKGTMS